MLSRLGNDAPMDAYKLLLGIAGVVLIGAAWLPHLLRRSPLSFPIVYVAIGWLLYQCPLPLPEPDQFEYGVLVERLTELVVLVALTSAGLRIDTPIGWKRWNATWRVLGIAMPLCIAAGALLGEWLLGLGLASACLLGAALAPTDPVLAGAVQVGPPGDGDEDEVRLTLTSEAGLNDGLSFPFVWLAITLATVSAGNAEPTWLRDWLLIDVLYRIGAGVAIGWLLGYALMWLVFRVGVGTRIAHTGDGLAALGITLTVYGVAEAAHAYGFLAVFVAATAIRHHERTHRYHEAMTTFAEQCERLLMTGLLILFGGALADGILDDVDFPQLAFALLFVLVVRPLSGVLALTGCSKLRWRERLAIGAFGVRGIGSIYYIAFALNHAHFAMAPELWSIVSLVVLLSILLHGLTATSLMEWLDSAKRGTSGSNEKRVGEPETLRDPGGK